MVGVVIDIEEEGPDTDSPLSPTNQHQESYKDILISPDLDNTQQVGLPVSFNSLEKVFIYRKARQNLSSGA